MTTTPSILGGSAAGAGTPAPAAPDGAPLTAASPQAAPSPVPGVPKGAPPAPEAKAGEKPAEKQGSILQDPTKGEKKPEAKPGEQPASKLELKFPEGVKPDPGLLQLAELAHEKGLSPEGAQEMANGFLAHQQKIEADRVKSWEGTLKGWQDAVRADAEFGGAKFEGTAAAAEKALATLDPSGELGAWLRDTGFGSFPPLVKALARHGLMNAEDNLALPASKAGPNGAQDRSAQLRGLFDNSPELFEKR